jgi:3-phosphoshikimate 1-carboxyvinyltransferase
LCSQAEGKSVLYGAPHLKAKESDRIQKTSELLTVMQITHQAKSDGIEIQGKVSASKPSTRIKFSPDQDHRMAMAAALAKSFGYNLHIQTPEVVQKSFPQFWQLTEVHP